MTISIIQKPKKEMGAASYSSDKSKMKNLIETLRSKKTGYGHFSISIEMDGKEFKTTTTNTMAIDAAFDDCYDDEDNSGRYYESREEAQEALVNEILRANEIEL